MKPTTSVFVTQQPRTHTLAVLVLTGEWRGSHFLQQIDVFQPLLPFLLAIFQYLKRGSACEAQTGLSCVTYLSVLTAE